MNKMIRNRKDLRFYMVADRIMNGFQKGKTLRERMVNIVDAPVNGAIIKYLEAMRRYSYYKNTLKNNYSFKFLLMIYWHRKWNKLGIKLGFSIGPDSLGYGVVLPHHGTIVVNENARIGNFAVIHTSTCVAGGDKDVGDYFYLSVGSQLVGKLSLGDGVSVAAHSLVNHSFEDSVLLAGAPAHVIKKEYPLWPDRDGVQYRTRVEKVMKIKEIIYG